MRIRQLQIFVKTNVFRDRSHSGLFPQGERTTRVASWQNQRRDWPDGLPGTPHPASATFPPSNAEKEIIHSHPTGIL
jgi:hypothetical protein